MKRPTILSNTAGFLITFFFFVTAAFSGPRTILNDGTDVYHKPGGVVIDNLASGTSVDVKQTANFKEASGYVTWDFISYGDDLRPSIGWVLDDNLATSQALPPQPEIDMEINTPVPSFAAPTEQPPGPKQSATKKVKKGAEKPHKKPSRYDFDVGPLPKPKTAPHKTVPLTPKNAPGVFGEPDTSPPGGTNDPGRGSDSPTGPGRPSPQGEPGDPGVNPGPPPFDDGQRTVIGQLQSTQGGFQTTIKDIKLHCAKSASGVLSGCNVVVRVGIKPVLSVDPAGHRLACRILLSWRANSGEQKQTIKEATKAVSIPAGGTSQTLRMNFKFGDAGSTEALIDNQSCTIKATPGSYSPDNI